MLTLTLTLMFCTIVGVGAGMMASALGVGASLIFVPVLLAIAPTLGVPAGFVPTVAIATSLAASCFVTLTGAAAHWRAGNLTRDLTLQASPLLAFAAAGGIAGGLFIAHVESVAVTIGLAIAQALVAIVLTLRGRIGTAAAAASLAGELANQRTRVYVAGVGALTSIGAGGVFLVPFFLWRGLGRIHAVALASLLGIAITPVATVVFVSAKPAVSMVASMGFVHLPLAISLAAGSVYGSALGVRAAKASTSGMWTRLLAVALLLSSARAIARIV